jgi:hypothetical protein
MIQSKQIKLDPYKEPKFPILDGVLSDVFSFFRRYYNRISRSLAYAKFGYTNYDYECQFIYPFISFKLKRIKKCLLSGYGVQEQTDLDALDEAVAICDRLFNECYEDKYMINHDIKWGESTFTFDPFTSTRKYRITEEDKTEEWKEHLDILNKAEKDKEVDMDRLAYIMKNNFPNLWD